MIQRTEQVQARSKVLTLAEQKERRRFSQILHENLQQLLFATKMQLGQHLEEHVEDPTVSADHKDDIIEAMQLIKKALEVTKTTSIELNPPVLKTQGLDATLHWLAHHMGQNYGLHVDLKTDSRIKEIKNDVQIMLVQMVRELLVNVVRHTGVMEASIVAECRDKNVIIKVEDQGRGFKVSEAKKIMGGDTTLGLFSIEERLGLFGGKFLIDSQPGKGT